MGPAVILRDDVRAALTGLGFNPREAREAIQEATAHVGAAASLEEWLRAALRALHP